MKASVEPVKGEDECNAGVCGTNNIDREATNIVPLAGITVAGSAALLIVIPPSHLDILSCWNRSIQPRGIKEETTGGEKMDAAIERILEIIHIKSRVGD